MNTVVTTITTTTTRESASLDRVEEVYSDGGKTVRYKYREPESQINWHNDKAFRDGSLAPLASVAFIVLLLIAVASAMV